MRFEGTQVKAPPLSRRRMLPPTPLRKSYSYGDGLKQNIVTNLGEGSRKGLTNELREFIKIDNHRAFEVGYQNEGRGKCSSTKAERISRISGGHGQEEPR